MNRSERDAAVVKNLPLVKHMYKAYRGYALEKDRDDLFQEACLGLMEGAKRWNPARANGMGFGNYAAWAIKARIGHCLRKGSSLIPVPPKKRREAQTWERNFGHINPTDGPSLRGSRLGWVKEEESVVPFVAPKVLGELCNKAQVSRLLQVLTPTQVKVIKARYLEPEALTLREIGERMGISHERVRQIEGEALARMREKA